MGLRLRGRDRFFQEPTSDGVVDGGLNGVTEAQLEFWCVRLKRLCSHNSNTRQQEDCGEDEKKERPCDRASSLYAYGTPHEWIPS
jgi:hypothetical protein